MISAKLSAVFLFLAAAGFSVPSAYASPTPMPQADPSQVQSPVDFLFIARGACSKTQSNGDGVLDTFCDAVTVGGDPDVGGNRGRDQDNINRINNRDQLRNLAQQKCRDKQTPPGNLLFRFNNCRFAQNDERQEAIRQLCIAVDGEGDVCDRLGVPVNSNSGSGNSGSGGSDAGSSGSGSDDTGSSGSGDSGSGDSGSGSSDASSSGSGDSGSGGSDASSSGSGDSGSGNSDQGQQQPQGPPPDPSQVQSPVDFLFIARGACANTQSNGDATLDSFCDGVAAGNDPDVGGNRGRNQDNINRISNRDQLRTLAQQKCRDKETPPGRLLFRFNNCRFAQNDQRQEAIRQLCIAVDGEGDVCGRLGVPVN
ncbi:hypothetical protein HK102_001159 [Quaeritorhiza haematococci]|nr:hypothetical protein HK102_001159 [Quaeritorhiza haematococci]